MSSLSSSRANWQSMVSSGINKNLCEAFNCFAEATRKIDVKVGHNGTIVLNLCNDCVKKFQEDIL